MYPVGLILFAHDTHGMFDSTACSDFIQFDWDFFLSICRATDRNRPFPLPPPSSIEAVCCEFHLFDWFVWGEKKNTFSRFRKMRSECASCSDQHWTEYFHDPRTDELLWTQSELIWISMNFVIKLWRQLLSSRDEFISGFLIWISMIKARVPLGLGVKFYANRLFLYVIWEGCRSVSVEDV